MKSFFECAMEIKYYTKDDLIKKFGADVWKEIMPENEQNNAKPVV